MDANILFPPYPAHRLIDQVEELVPGARVGVPGSVRRELEALRSDGEPGAVVACTLADRLPSVPNRGVADDAILAAATRLNGIVLTADRGLQGRLLRLGLDVLVPRDRSRLHLLRGGPARRAATVKSPPPVDGRPTVRRRR